MQAIERVKRHIETAEDLQSVVKTMKALAAVSLRQYERAVASLAEYNRTVDMGLRVVLRHQTVARPHPHALREARIGALVFGSDHGLCGRFNDQIVDHALATLPTLTANTQPWRVCAVGTRAAMGLEERHQSVDATMLMPASLGGVTPLVQDLLHYIETWRTQQRLDTIVVLHHRPLSGSAYAPHLVHLVPIDLTHFYTLMSEPWPSRSLPTFTMDANALLSALLRQHLFVSLYRAVAESLASEHASRLTAMQAAERSISERLDELQAQFRYQRQHAITEELLDIVSGFEALSGAPGMEATTHPLHPSA